MLAGFAVISHWMPFLLFSVYAVSLADRYDCRRLIQVSQGLFALASLAWAVLFLTGTLRIWHAAGILLIHGAAGVIGLPASQLLVYDIVGPERLPSAIRLNATSRYLAILFGPAVGGGLMLLLGPGFGLLANIAIYAPFTIYLLFMPYTGHRRDATGRRSARFSLAEIGRLLGQARSDPRLLTMILLGGATSFLVGNAFQAQMPEYAHHLGADEAGAWYSVLLAANAVGAIIGAVLLESATLIPLSARGDQLRRGVGRADGGVSGGAQLPGRGDGPRAGGHLQRRVHVDGPDHRAATVAASPPRQHGRPLQHVDARPACRQRPHCGSSRRPDRRPMVLDPELRGGGGSGAGAPRDGSPRPHSADDLKIQVPLT